MTKHTRIPPALKGLDLADVLMRLFQHRFAPEGKPERWLGQEALIVAVAVLTAPVLPVRRSDLEGRTGLQATAVTRAINVLVETGWLRREADPADRRQALLWPGKQVTTAAD
ncbi:hypothetical protein CRT60_01030 [Azospirillum palustre]|uniref:HTH marR-type domain-containing protein n=1 Tax=Azospirillum palustre TaxID=2044885 RepID=A0A2B8BN12_9PROT|nr:helix-turn-helix domain-containing protein [Azospirillum palustre]PGH59245.1 hypothetical protein CRT60_01030 [Azospirillum palustre]